MKARLAKKIYGSAIQPQPDKPPHVGSRYTGEQMRRAAHRWGRTLRSHKAADPDLSGWHKWSKARLWMRRANLYKRAPRRIDVAWDRILGVADVRPVN